MRRLTIILTLLVGTLVIAAPSCEPPSSSVPVGQAGAWTPLFVDEFSGTQLDTAKWTPSWHAGTNISPPVNSSEQSCYDPRQSTVGGGALILTIETNSPVRAGCRLRSGSSAPLVSGLVETDGKFNGFVPGTYAEARVWLSPGSGTPTDWAAFWTDGHSWPNDGEVDVMEVLSGGTVRAHVHDSTGGPGSPTYLPGASAGWHTFAAWRHSTSVDFYYDGKPFWNGPIHTTAPHYLIANLGVSSGSVRQVPAHMLVDYVRVWREPR